MPERHCPAWPSPSFMHHREAELRPGLVIARANFVGANFGKESNVTKSYLDAHGWLTK